MKRFLDFFSWGFLLLFFVPTGLILASWNALPGDTLYGTKLAFEGVLLTLVKPSLSASGSLSIKYTERRFAESKQLLADKHSVEGLPYLDKQVIETKNIIATAPQGTTKKELAQTYIATLQSVSSQLEVQKQIALSQAGQPTIQTSFQTPTTSTSPPAQTGVSPTPVSVVIPATPTPEQVQPTPSAAAPSSPASTISQINQTEETINQTIQQMQTLSVQSSDQEKENGGGNQNNNGNQGQGQNKDTNQGKGQGKNN